MNSAIRARREAEDGFTLIELLVVVIIIGILAAIAIPAFLNQRERAWQAELVSATRNAALDLEAEATSNGGAYEDTATGDGVAETWVTDNVGAIGTPIQNVVYTAYLADGTTVAGAGVDGAGFVLCLEHDLINGGVNSVEYWGGSVGNGMQAFDDTAAC